MVLIYRGKDSKNLKSKKEKCNKKHYHHLKEVLLEKPTDSPSIKAFKRKIRKNRNTLHLNRLKKFCKAGTSLKNKIKSDSFGFHPSHKGSVYSFYANEEGLTK